MLGLKSFLMTFLFGEYLKQENFFLKLATWAELIF